MKNTLRFLLVTGLLSGVSVISDARPDVIRIATQLPSSDLQAQENKMNPTQMSDRDTTQLDAAFPSKIYDYSVFAPKQQTSNTKFDYSIWDSALQDVVLRMGPSLRTRASRPNAIVGTRFVRGHTSPYRLEGARLSFSYLSDKYVESLKEYRTDLVHLANTIDIQSMSRKEQLAFWYNLHNVLLIETIAEHYPIKRPRQLVLGSHGERLHDAKLITIKGVPLSLRDIREKIVYSNWHNPDVMYGFYLGDIGGTGLMPYAITAKNVNYVLAQQSNEFINSLRGYHDSSKAHMVSKIYEEARPYFFKNWPTDLEKHLLKHANIQVLQELNTHKPYKISRYDMTIADLMGGDLPSTTYNVTSSDGSLNSKLPPEIARLAKELRQKRENMRHRGMFNGTATVTISDIDTEDPDTPKQEDNP